MPTVAKKTTMIVVSWATYDGHAHVKENAIAVDPERGSCVKARPADFLEAQHWQEAPIGLLHRNRTPRQ